MWVGLGVWCGGCGVGGVKNVYFRCGLGWECGVVDVVWGGAVKNVYFRSVLGWGVVLSVLFDLREHIQNLNVFFFCCYIIFLLCLR